MHEKELQWKPRDEVAACMSRQSNRHCRPKAKYHEEASMNALYYNGLVIHKKSIALFIK
jgi:hypothetical protein